MVSVKCQNFDLLTIVFIKAFYIERGSISFILFYMA